MLVSRQLHLLPGQRFKYFVDSDMGNRYGAGTHQRRGQQLRLTFDGQPLGPADASVQVRPLPAGPDSLTLTFQVQALAYHGDPAPLSGATVLARDDAGRTLAGRATDPAGRPPCASPGTNRRRRSSYQTLAGAPWCSPVPVPTPPMRCKCPPTWGIGTPPAPSSSFRLYADRPTGWCCGAAPIRLRWRWSHQPRAAPGSE